MNKLKPDHGLKFTRGTMSQEVWEGTVHKGAWSYLNDAKAFLKIENFASSIVLLFFEIYDKTHCELLA